MKQKQLDDLFEEFGAAVAEALSRSLAKVSALAAVDALDACAVVCRVLFLTALTSLNAISDAGLSSDEVSQKSKSMLRDLYRYFEQQLPNPEQN